MEFLDTISNYVQTLLPFEWVKQNGININSIDIKLSVTNRFKNIYPQNI